MPREVLLIRSRRYERMRKRTEIQHVFGAFFLMANGFNHLTPPEPHHLLIPILELLAGATLLGAVIRDKVKKTHSRVAWVELAGAAMLFVEALAKLEEKHHTSFYILSFVPPALLLTFALLDERFRESLRMEANDTEFLIQTNRFFPKRVRWEGLHSYVFTQNTLALRGPGEKVTQFNLRPIENGEEARAWAEAQFVSRGLTNAGSPPPPSAG
ncbi:MAG: hypothetical protein M3Q69_15190 [Acidobacteriota bacterium]|nr:hypothetical protein [Acidobacteriota bacterium]